MRIIVGTADLRRALTSVLPHLEKADAAGEDTFLTRVRLVEGTVNLTLVATDTHTVAAAVVSIWEGSEHDGAVLDISPDVARKILAVHKSAKARSQGGEFEPEQSLLLETVPATDSSDGEDGEAPSGRSLVTRDVSGLFEGDESLTVPLLDVSENFPDMAGYLGEAIHGHDVVECGYDGQPVSVPADWLARFGVAAKAYKAPLVLRVTGVDRYRLLVTVGDSFAGLCSLSHPADQDTPDQQDAVQAWSAWLSRLPERMTRHTTTGDQPDNDEAGDGKKSGSKKRKGRRLQPVDD